jgi:DNA-binding transcriptional ArsR family regulator
MTDATSVCRAFAHPVRRALLRALVADECDVSNLGEACGLDQPSASKHLAALRDAGLVQVRVFGRHRCYSLTRPEIVAQMLDLLAQVDSSEP